MSKDNGLLQNLTTLLAYAIPVLQFFFALLPSSIISFFAFRDYFLIVSIFTAVLSYILILVIKSTPYFKWSPFQGLRKWKNQEYITYTDKAIYTSQEIKNYQKNNKIPKTIREINSTNMVIKLLVPLIVLSFLYFCITGALSIGGVEYFKSHPVQNVILSSSQALAYSVFLVASVIAFANQFLRETGLQQYRREKSEKYDKVIDLARKRNGFNEYKTSNLMSQFQRTDPQGETHWIFYVKVGDDYYVIITDVNVDIIDNIEKFKTKKEADTFLAS